MGVLSTNINDPESMILYGILLAIWIRDAWEAYLVFRQWRVVFDTTKVPDVLVGIYSVANLARVRLYYLDILVYLMVYALFDILSKSVVLLFDLISIFWTWGIAAAQFIGMYSESETVRSILFLLIVHTVQFLCMLPFTLYLQIAIGNRYNPQKKTVANLILAAALSYLLNMIVILIFTPLLLFVVGLAGQYLFISLWLLHVFFVAFIIFVYMGIMVPKMGQITPLEDGELKDSIEVLAARVNFPLAQIYVYKTPESSTERNAFFYGFCGSKRIVLYDNLIALLSVEEVVGVVAHELGHWKGDHSMKNLIFVEIYYASIFAAAHFLFPLDIIYKTFNFRNSQPMIIGLIIIFDFIFIPCDYVFTFSLTFLTRHFEYDADAFARKLGEGQHLRSALIHLSRGSLSFPADDWLFSMFNYDHPTLLERLDRLPE